MGEGEGRGHIHFAADDLDIGAGFAGACSLHRLVEFAKRLHTRRVPLGAPERLGQVGVVPGREVVVSPVRVFFQRALNQITAIASRPGNWGLWQPSDGWRAARDARLMLLENSVRRIDHPEHHIVAPEIGQVLEHALGVGPVEVRFLHDGVAQRGRSARARSEA
jgi:hypothetical protein